ESRSSPGSLYEPLQISVCGGFRYLELVKWFGFHGHMQSPDPPYNARIISMQSAEGCWHRLNHACRSVVEQC
ncbi:MAG: hypothetical protein ACLUBW_10500, partial [Sutterella wadsworthensis]|uniref:hypothetical protein n=1 Tax=Sutterella wadsworthensis TaxID=40545 RepID=UPI003992D679